MMCEWIVLWWTGSETKETILPMCDIWNLPCAISNAGINTMNVLKIERRPR